MTRISRAGASRQWVYVFQWQGSRKEMGLGSLADVELGEAREAAMAARKLVRGDKNPIEVRREARAAIARPTSVPTFGEAAEALIKDLEVGWRSPKHRAHWRATLDQHAATLKHMPVDRVGTEDVLEVLKPLWTTKPDTASKLRGRIERVLDAARARGQRTGENPARLRGHLALLLPKQPRLVRGHHPALPFDQVASFAAELRQLDQGSAIALELVILTAARTGEVLGATWAEIDEAAAVWTVPAERMKGGREHRVPLAPRALEILEAMKPLRREGELIFPGARKGRPMSGMAMEMLLRRMKRADITVHGFRSTFRDWAGDRTGFQREVIEAALAHIVGDKAEQAYRRGDALEKRRKLMEAWAAYVATPAIVNRNVVDLRRPG